MVVGTTTETFPVAAYSGGAQVTDSLGTSVSSDLFNGTTNGRRIREIQIWTGATGGPAPGTKLIIYFYDGSANRILNVIDCPGGALTKQGTVTLPVNFVMTGATKAIRAQLTTGLPSGVTLDFVANGEDF